MQTKEDERTRWGVFALMVLLCAVPYCVWVGPKKCNGEAAGERQTEEGAQSRARAFFWCLHISEPSKLSKWWSSSDASTSERWITAANLLRILLIWLSSKPWECVAFRSGAFDVLPFFSILPALARVCLSFTYTRDATNSQHFA